MFGSEEPASCRNAGTQRQDALPQENEDKGRGSSHLRSMVFTYRAMREQCRNFCSMSAEFSAINKVV